ncbi:Serine/threonine-protein kinase TIO [Vitis vinifera]|uniref:non-specific serine/threonine protein kinase n=1 Tax=Vitis vinifera TaxID=29760 RepID=A0A438E1Z9_VITVI|nr:Serine/threonine-protein kinase TIO [Vitis vinifera]
MHEEKALGSRYELFVGQPPFYTNSVYALIRHIIKVPQNRLTWPALLEHPFVQETSDELEAREMRAATAAARGCDAAWRGEGNIIQASTGSTVPSPENRSHSPAAFESNNASKIQSGAQSCSPNSATVNSSPHEEFPGIWQS